MFKRFSKSLTIILIFLAFSGYEAFACFVQGKEPIWDTFSKKKIDLEIDFAGYYNKDVDGNPNAGHWKQKDLTKQKFFDFDDIKPGDWGEGTISLHLKNQDAWGCAIIRPTENDDNGSNTPELLDGDTSDTPDIWDGELAQNLHFTIWADTCNKKHAKPGDNIYQPDCDKLLTSGTGPAGPSSAIKLALADSESLNIFNEKNKPLKKDNDYYIGASWNVPASVGNIIQTDRYRADITFYVEQADGNKNFRCADLNDQNPGKCVDGATRSCFSGDAEENNVGICRSGTETCARGEWGKCEGEILPDKEICGDGKDNNCDGDIDENCPPLCTKKNEKNDCNDHNSKTDDSCVKGECVNKEPWNRKIVESCKKIIESWRR